jgi:PEP-CTERM motif
VLAGNVHAVTFTTTGATTLTGPTYNRPVTLTLLSGVGTAVHYNALSFAVSTSGSYDFLSLAAAGWDNFLALYTPSFSPAAGLGNLVALNDDFPGAGIGTAGFTFALTSGTNYVLVTTGFGNNDVGAFTNTITGPGSVIPSAIPEPGSYALMALGMLAIGFASLKRKKG